MIMAKIFDTPEYARLEVLSRFGSIRDVSSRWSARACSAAACPMTRRATKPIDEFAYEEVGNR